MTLKTHSRAAMQNRAEIHGVSGWERCIVEDHRASVVVDTDHAAFPVRKNKPVVKPKPSIDPVACLHRGEQTGEEVCKSCGGNVRIKLFACAVHGQCSIRKPLDRVATCAGCKDRREPIACSGDREKPTGVGA